MFSLKKNNVILITPPFVQLNSPYPATQYLSGFLKDQKIKTIQYDLSIKVFLKLFSKGGLIEFFELLDIQINEDKNLKNYIFNNSNLSKIYNNQMKYISTIDSVISFLQGINTFSSYKIITRKYLPEAKRFDVVNDLEKFNVNNQNLANFDTLEKSRYYCSLYIDDLTDFFNETILPNFGLSKYAEKIATNITSFDNLFEAVKNEKNNDYITTLFLKEIDTYNILKSDIVLLTIPFPGNLFSSLKISYFLKKKYKDDIKIVLGGGFVNTELRQLADKRIFDFADFITLDDGFLPVKQIINLLIGQVSRNDLIRTFSLENGKIKYHNNLTNNKSLKDVGRYDFSFKLDYNNLNFNDYISLSESPNKMNRLWSEKGWNKLYLAHGCYWKRCAFCDTSLDYINNFYPLSINQLINQIENAIKETGSNGFHFVDEAMPPNIMKKLAIELIRRKIDIAWWGNIRFETAFDLDLCRLLKESGCIAVTGGFEVVTDRLLKLMDKGVDTKNVALVCDNFKKSDILVHTYLIYGFPTQTLNETIDALEIIRQFFHLKITDSAYWHRFSLTVHSPIAKNSKKFNIESLDKTVYPFANNDIEYKETMNSKNRSFLKNIDNVGMALKKATYNFMFGIESDRDVLDWFENIDNLSKPTIKNNFIKKSLRLIRENEINLDYENNIKNKKLIWIGNSNIKVKKIDSNYAILTLSNSKNIQDFEMPILLGNWIKNVLKKASIYNKNITTNDLQIWEIEKDFPNSLGLSFQEFLINELWLDIKELGLLHL